MFALYKYATSIDSLHTLRNVHYVQKSRACKPVITVIHAIAVTVGTIQLVLQLHP
jgi:hypothetical protein